MNGIMSTDQVINSERKPLMGISMIVVMLFHLWCSYPAYMRSPITDWTIGFGHLGNEVFFFLAGMGCWYSYSKNDVGTYFKRRLYRLLHPCTLAGFIKTFLVIPEGNFLISLISFNLWFIVAYLVLAFLMPLFAIILSLIKGRFFIFILFLFAYSALVILTQWLIPEIPNGILHIAKRGAVTFMTGAWLASSYEIGKDYLKKVPLSLHYVWVGLMITCYFINLYWISEHSMRLNIREFHNYFIWIALCCPSFIYIASHLLLKVRASMLFVTGAFSFIGSITLELYLFHEFIFQIFHDSSGVKFCFPLAAFSMITISFLIAWSFHCWINAILAKWRSPN